VAKITISKTARSDLKDIIDYIKRDSIRYAYLEKVKIEGTINRLILQPFIGRVVPELENENYRELIIGSFTKFNLKTISIFYLSTTTPDQHLIILPFGPKNDFQPCSIKKK
jgi:plasmid stabilization system protein ParE